MSRKPNDYYYRLRTKVDNLERCKERPIALTLKLLWWLARNSVVPVKREPAPAAEVRQPDPAQAVQPAPAEEHREERDHHEETACVRDAKTIRIALFEGGGLGDALIQTLYIKEMKKRMACDSVFEFYSKTPALAAGIPYIDANYPITKQIDRREYDVVIISRRFYLVDVVNRNKVRRLDPAFYDFCVRAESHRVHVLGDSFENDNLLTQYAMLFGKNRIEQANTQGLLPVTRETPYFLDWKLEAEDVLNKNDLEPGRYITLSRAVGTAARVHPKLWPLEYFEELVRLLKAACPQFRFVQLGAADTPARIKGTDLDLVGKTSIEETKVLLKYAALHIDVEGGLVHLRRALNGRSVVMFGPTLPGVFGYRQNFNLRSAVCPNGCEWVTKGWTEACLRTGGDALCQRSLPPERAFGAAIGALQMRNDSVLRYTFTNDPREFLCAGHVKSFQAGEHLETTLEMLALLGKDAKFTLVSRFDADGVYLTKRLVEKIGLDKSMALEFGTPLNLPTDDESLDILALSPDAFAGVRDIAKLEFELKRVLKKKGVAIVRNTPETAAQILPEGAGSHTEAWIVITKEEGDKE